MNLLLFNEVNGPENENGVNVESLARLLNGNRLSLPRLELSQSRLKGVKPPSGGSGNQGVKRYPSCSTKN